MEKEMVKAKDSWEKESSEWGRGEGGEKGCLA